MIRNAVATYARRYIMQKFIRNAEKRLIMQTQHTEIAVALQEKRALLRYDFHARRYRQGSEVFHVGDSLEIEVAPDVWLPVRVQSGSIYSDDGWIFTTPTGIDILPKEGLPVRRHTNHSYFF
jgi:Domain of unknown function (DUF5348)